MFLEILENKQEEELKIVTLADNATANSFQKRASPSFD